MSIANDDSRAQAPPLRTSRDPKQRAAPGEAGSLGQQAFMDSLILIGVAWLVLIFLAGSLRHHNI